jgi:hypothetical protein
MGIVQRAWTPRLRLVTAVCAAIFTVGTLLQNVVIIDLEMVTHAMRLAGSSEAEAAADAPGFLAGLRAVGWVFVVGNAVGLLATRARPWLFWVIGAVNVGQAAGVGMIPPVVFQASLDLYGPVGLLPTVVTDGGALVLVVVLAIALVRARVPRPVAA